MRAIGKYKAMVEEVGQMLFVFANFKDYPFSQVVKEQGWTLGNIRKIQDKVQCFGDIADQIKGELIGDGDEAKFKGRLRTAFFELSEKPVFAPSYFPVFDENLFELPSSDFPDRNKEMVDALTDVYGSDAGNVMWSLGVIVQWANIIVDEVEKRLDEICLFVGFTPEHQQEQQRIEQTASTIPTINDTDKEKLVFGNALQKQYMSLDNGSYKWTLAKSLLAYMCGRLYCGDRIKEDKSDYSEEYVKGNTQMPAQEVKKLFGGVDVASNRYSLKAPPRNHFKIDDLFKGNGASK